MERFFIHMAYDGSDYSGWQVQPDGVTIQQVLEHALSTLLLREIKVSGAGRTDTGVHASNFIAHFDLDPLRDQARQKKAGEAAPDSAQFIFRLNRFLPPDIIIYDIWKVQENMHARFSAVYRSYHYHISSVKPIYARKYRHYVYGELDTETINSCCRVLLETSDFTSFARLHSDVKTNNCKVSHALWREVPEGYRFEITADRFLRNMVRSITGTLLDVGHGKTDLEGFKNIVRAKDRTRAGSSAPARGLFLADIGYPDFNAKSRVPSGHG